MCVLSGKNHVHLGLAQFSLAQRHVDGKYNKYRMIVVSASLLFSTSPCGIPCLSFTSRPPRPPPPPTSIKLTFIILYIYICSLCVIISGFYQTNLYQSDLSSLSLSNLLESYIPIKWANSSEWMKLQRWLRQHNWFSSPAIVVTIHP